MRCLTVLSLQLLPFFGRYLALGVVSPHFQHYELMLVSTTLTYSVVLRIPLKMWSYNPYVPRHRFGLKRVAKLLMLRDERHRSFFLFLAVLQAVVQ